MVSRDRTLRTSRFAPLLAAAGAAIAIVFGSGPAEAQENEIRALYDRIDRLEQSLIDVQSQVYRGEPPPATAAPGAGGANPNVAARQSIRITELEGEIRNLTGQLEELRFLVEQTKTRVDKLVEDIDFRLTSIERNMAAQTGQGATSGSLPRAAPRPKGVAVVTTQGASPKSLGQVAPSDLAGAAPARTSDAPADAALPEGSLKEQYDFAHSLLRQGKYDEAERAFVQFVASYPDDPLAGNAQYWLGESYYARKDYQRAASAFLAGYQKFHDNPKAADNLLKLSMTLAAMGQKEEACAALGQLSEEYPDASTAIKRRAKNQGRRAGCR